MGPTTHAHTLYMYVALCVCVCVYVREYIDSQGICIRVKKIEENGITESVLARARSLCNTITKIVGRFPPSNFSIGTEHTRNGATFKRASARHGYAMLPETAHPAHKGGRRGKARRSVGGVRCDAATSNTCRLSRLVTVRFVTFSFRRREKEKIHT